MEKIKSVEELEVFKRSHRIAIEIYKVTERFPQNERLSLIAQMRRAAASIAANLMEGSHRLHRKEFRQFTGISRGSVGELKYHLLLAKDLGYLSADQYQRLREETEEISKMLNGLIKSLSASGIKR